MFCRKARGLGFVPCIYQSMDMDYLQEVVMNLDEVVLFNGQQLEIHEDENSSELSAANTVATGRT